MCYYLNWQIFVPPALPIRTKTTQDATRTVTLDPNPAHELNGDTELYSDDLSSNYEAETAAELRYVCHELMAWHERACEVAATQPATAVPEYEAPAAPAPTLAFAFAICDRVQPAHSALAAITWRGQHKEHHPATGLVHRINVYYLDNGYWDYYREDELQAA